MIPTFRDGDFLKKCLVSVLMQDAGPAEMQICVVDDDPEDKTAALLVAGLGHGRVEYHRNDRNLGAGGNFNRCIDLSRGELILLLHGDDTLLPDYFTKMADLARSNPTVGMLACRAIGIDEADVAKWVSLRYKRFEETCFDDSPIWDLLNLMPSAVVVRSGAYREVGGFLEDLNACQDWEMWARLIRRKGIRMTPDVLANYRQHSNSISGRTVRDGSNVFDFMRLSHIFALGRPTFPLEKLLKSYATLAYHQMRDFEKQGDHEAARANQKVWEATAPLASRVKTLSKHWLKRLVRR